MPYTIVFVDLKLYQSLAFDADMKFPKASEYTKKAWVLKEYKKAGGELNLTQESLKKTFGRTHSSYELQKSYEGNELIVQLVQSIKLSDDFNYFSEAEIDTETGEQELDQILSKIKASNFNMSKIAEIFGLEADLSKFGDCKQSSETPEVDEEECSPDCECDCEGQ